MEGTGSEVLEEALGYLECLANGLGEWEDAESLWMLAAFEIAADLPLGKDGP